MRHSKRKNKENPYSNPYGGSPLLEPTTRRDRWKAKLYKKALKKLAVKIEDVMTHSARSHYNNGSNNDESDEDTLKASGSCKSFSSAVEAEHKEDFFGDGEPMGPRGFKSFSGPAHSTEAESAAHAQNAGMLHRLPALQYRWDSAQEDSESDSSSDGLWSSSTSSSLITPSLGKGLSSTNYVQPSNKMIKHAAGLDEVIDEETDLYPYKPFNEETDLYPYDEVPPQLVSSYSAISPKSPEYSPSSYAEEIFGLVDEARKPATPLRHSGNIISTPQRVTGSRRSTTPPVYSFSTQPVRPLPLPPALVSAAIVKAHKQSYVAASEINLTTPVKSVAAALSSQLGEAHFAPVPSRLPYRATSRVSSANTSVDAKSPSSLQGLPSVSMSGSLLTASPPQALDAKDSSLSSNKLPSAISLAVSAEGPPAPPSSSPLLNVTASTAPLPPPPSSLPNVKASSIPPSLPSVKASTAPPPPPPPPPLPNVKASTAPPPPPPPPPLPNVKVSTAPPPPPPIPPPLPKANASRAPPPPPPPPLPKAKGSTPPPPPPLPKVKASTTPSPPIPPPLPNAKAPPAPPPHPSAPPPPPAPKGPPPPSLPNATQPPLPSKPLEGLSSAEKEDTLKIKQLHWDKVSADPSHSMVWDRLRTGSFHLDEDTIATRFAINAPTTVKKEVGKSRPPPVKKGPLDPRKAQNIAIQLRALNISTQGVCDALLEGEGLKAELLEVLVKMLPTQEEQKSLLGFDGDRSGLGPAERFLISILEIPSAFQRLEAMQFKAGFREDVSQIKESLENLEVACGQIRDSRLFLKLLEAVLKTGNVMNRGTARGEAVAFKLDTLLKLSDVKSQDGKTTLLHFVVEEIIKAEGLRVVRAGKEADAALDLEAEKGEEDVKRKGLEAVLHLFIELQNVKSAAGIDADSLSQAVLKIANRLSSIQTRLKTTFQAKVSSDADSPSTDSFLVNMEKFCSEAEEDVAGVKQDLSRVFDKVKEATAYFHGNQRETQPLRLLVIVRDFLSVLERVCKDIAKPLKMKVRG